MAFKYQQLAQQIAHKIHVGELPAGEALSSLRRFAEHHSISLSTANKTYQWLEQQGLIHARPKSGYFVRAAGISALHNQAIASDHDQAVLVEQDTSDIILNVHQNVMRKELLPFGGGFLSPQFLPVQALQRSLIRTARRKPESAYSYGHAQGDPSLRHALCERLAERECHFLPEQIIITNGCLEAVILSVMELSAAGETVAIFTPCYSGLLLSLHNLGRNILEIPCASDGPDMSVLENLMAEQAFKVLILSAIAYNPLGFNLSVEVKQRIAALAHQYQSPLIEDDAYGELAYHGQPNSPIVSYASRQTDQKKSAPIIYCGSFSKALTTGFRVGWLATHGNISPFIKRKLSINLTSSQPPQVGLADYLYSEGYRAHINRLRGVLEREINCLSEAVLRHFPTGTQLGQVRGGMFVWVKLPENLESMDLYQAALAHNISLSPGEVFSMAGMATHCIRLSASHPWSDEREAAVVVLGKLTEGLLRAR